MKTKQKQMNKMEQEKITIIGQKVAISTKENEIWLSAHEIATLFECFVAKVTSNIRSILKTGVLSERDVQQTYYYQNGNSVDRYNLEMIIALSFRIKSKNANVFRQWIVKRIVSNPVEIKMLTNTNWNDFSLN